MTPLKWQYNKSSRTYNAHYKGILLIIVASTSLNPTGLIICRKLALSTNRISDIVSTIDSYVK